MATIIFGLFENIIISTWYESTYLFFLFTIFPMTPFDVLFFTLIDSGCRTPKDEDGVCINIDDCQSLRTLLEFQKHVESVLEFLKSSICGFIGKIPKVCCPLESSFPSTPTPRRKMESTVVSGADLSPKLPSQTACGQTNVSRIRIFGGTPSELG